MDNLFNGFSGMHSLESIIGLVTASLVIKGIEQCADRCCKENTDVHDALHTIETAIEKQMDEEIPHRDLLDFVSEAPTVLLPVERTVSDLESIHTVYNLPVHPTRLAAKPIDPNRYVLTSLK